MPETQSRTVVLEELWETFCFPEEGSWCATCQGQCEEEEEDLDYSDSTPDDVSSERDWGFCDKDCFTERSGSQVRGLEEVRVRLLEDCHHSHLCVSHSSQLELPVYRKINSTFSLAGTRRSQAQGGSGTCQGDLGGPLYLTTGDLTWPQA